MLLPVCRFSIIIEYETSSSASALQWLTAQQTCGKKYPYLFSQGQVCTLITTYLFDLLKIYSFIGHTDCFGPQLFFPSAQCTVQLPGIKRTLINTKH